LLRAAARNWRTLQTSKPRIHAIAPSLRLPPRFNKPNPIFAKGELRRLAIDYCGKPMAVRDLALGALRAKGADRHTMKRARTRLRETFAALEAGLWRGVWELAGRRSGALV